ncbi:MAG: sigma-70 family RNA polymerase sigma factor [Frankiales bacterium]|nr:sigma-70 family RNA polymerase sigma factor [Frankiales bacterium]
MSDAERPCRDEAWLEALVLRHGNTVLAYARRRVPQDADDVAAEVFAAAWRYRDRVPEPALPWLYRTASHLVLHEHRSRSRRTALAARAASIEMPDGRTDDPADAVAARLDDADAVARALAGLSDRDAEVLRLWAWEQLEPAEIAYVLGVTAAAARVRLHRARRRAASVLLTDGAAGPEAAPAPARPVVPRRAVPAPRQFPLTEEPR